MRDIPEATITHLHPFSPSFTLQILTERLLCARHNTHVFVTTYRVLPGLFHLGGLKATQGLAQKRCLINMGRMNDCPVKK